MNAGEWILNIFLFFLALGILITIHELGHLTMAKIFNVYCREFSIGFGPKIFRKKRKKGETYFALRAIPLGGYVSMYGEETEELKDEQGDFIPPERSIEGIKKWKKAFILIAGIVMNVVLAFMLIGISNVCFPMLHATRRADVEEDSLAYKYGIRDEDEIVFYGPDETEKDMEDNVDPRLIQYEYQDKSTKILGLTYIIDPYVVMKNDDTDYYYVLTYYPTGSKHPCDLVDGMNLYPAYAADTREGQKCRELFFKAWTERDFKLNYYPDFRSQGYQPDDKTAVDVELTFYRESPLEEGAGSLDTASPDYPTFFKQFTLMGEKVGKDDYRWQSFGLVFRNEAVWAPFWTRVGKTFVDFGRAAGSIFEGLGMLFRGDLASISGPVGILNISASIYANYAFSMYLYFWGLISVNLAIFNLLPFPGLDGWGLLVTIIEGISRKKIPSKAKNIVSFIGLGILFAFMIVIVVLDILRWSGVL